MSLGWNPAGAEEEAEAEVAEEEDSAEVVKGGEAQASTTMELMSQTSQETLPVKSGINYHRSSCRR